MAEVPLPIAHGGPRPPGRTVPTPDERAEFAWGFFPEEREGTDAFRWMSTRGHLGCASRPVERFVELGVFCEFGDLSQELEARAGERCETLPLVDGWRLMSLRIPAGAEGVTLTANKPYPKSYYPSDSRTLSIRVRGPVVHNDPFRYESVWRQWSNAVLNAREMLDGKTILESTPPSLGIDMHGACNVKPPCVYCEWNAAKDQEGVNVDAPFTRKTLDEYGAFFGNATQLVNCSIGEPFMMKNLDGLFDVFGDERKTLEMTTNGQILTDRNIEKLLGRDIHLYISLDAATPETYARLRNDTFEKILHNIRRLVEAKGGHGNLPKVFLVFMPMRANVHELDAFIELSAELGVDQMILRPLNDTPGNGLEWERNGYRFDYEKELLPFEELVHVSGRAAELARHHGVDLHDQLDFGGSLEARFRDDFAAGRADVSQPAEEHEASHAMEPKPSLGFDRWPVCSEPWKDLYILRRGVRPCCYGGAPIDDMDGYGEAWNSPLLQAIREKLVAGGFHDYCVKSPACPIVRKSEHVNELPLRQEGFLVVWRLWQKLNALTDGVPRAILRKLRFLRRG
ncbi:MAG: hypothetical protein BMS9Abin37_0886 [Acidobacteriota bacterium]|nr:MAG: hypothetical protein BMS9Abin37_0886 [Acidobacteriota bacterium]